MNKEFALYWVPEFCESQLTVGYEENDQIIEESTGTNITEYAQGKYELEKAEVINNK